MCLLYWGRYRVGSKSLLCLDDSKFFAIFLRPEHGVFFAFQFSVGGYEFFLMWRKTFTRFLKGRFRIIGMDEDIHLPGTKIMTIYKMVLAKILNQPFFNFTQSLKVLGV